MFCTNQRMVRTLRVWVRLPAPVKHLHLANYPWQNPAACDCPRKEGAPFDGATHCLGYKCGPGRVEAGAMIPEQL